ncbi:MAG: sigma-54-dependent Fis family transcriptional regulator [Deltaproteobacteria bacterium]|nr:sigma-54-dependent Fis family transcriptional regulator [Deltaproteobacteria bacterium]
MKHIKKHTLLIVEDDDVMRKTLEEVFVKRGFHAHSVGCGMDAIKFVKKQGVDIVLLDIRLPDVDGIAVLKHILAIDDSIFVIVMTAYPDVKIAISAIKAGAYDFINKPFELEELKLLADKAVETQRLMSEVQRLRHKTGDECLPEMIGDSLAFSKVKEFILIVAKTPKTPVLIQGETGTGKELVANAIHCRSNRADMPLIKINCSAIADNLMEAELFGYEKGAFTDAKETKKGLLELADGGTIFFDEIGDMSIGLQPKLLRVLENHSFRRVGGIRDIKVDVRVVAATNKDLQSMVRKKEFRDDLYYRLKVMVIHIPPLREREGDIMPLAEHFIQLNNKDLGKDIEVVSPECRDILLQYSWPGNVRELKNIIERAAILANSNEILSEYLPRELVEDITAFMPAINKINSINATLEQVEKAHILHVLNSVNGNISQASRILGIARQHLRKKLKKYSIENS